MPPIASARLSSKASSRLSRRTIAIGLRGSIFSLAAPAILLLSFPCDILCPKTRADPRRRPIGAALAAAPSASERELNAVIRNLDFYGQNHNRPVRLLFQPGQ